MPPAPLSAFLDLPTEVAEGEKGLFIVSARANQDTTIAVRFDDLGDGIDLDIGGQPATRPRIRRGTAVNSDEDTLYFELTGDSAATCTTETPSVLSFDLTVADDDADRGKRTVDLVVASAPAYSGLTANDTLATVTVTENDDVTAPTVESGGVAITSSPASGTTYGTGENIEVTVTFDEPVRVTGAPTLDLLIGPLTRQATYVSSNGDGDALTFRYVTVAGDNDSNGISVPDNGLALAGGSIQDESSSANNAVLTFTGLGDDSDHKVSTGVTLVFVEALGDITEGAPARFRLTRSSDQTQLVMPVSVTVPDATVLSSTAPSSVTFDANSYTATVDLATEDDNISERDETITLRLVDSDANDAIHVPPAPGDAASVVVSDNDPLTARLVGAPTLEVVNGRPAEVLARFSPREYDVDFELRRVPVGETQAVVVATGTVAPDSETGGLSIAAVNARDHGGVYSLAPSSDYTLTGDDTLTMNVKSEVSVSAPDSEIVEGETASFTITRTDDLGPLVVAVIVTETGADVVSGGPSFSLTVSFADGETEKQLDIPTVDDGVLEPAATIRVLVAVHSSYEIKAGGNIAIITVAGATTPVEATVNGTRLVLSYNEALDTGSVPDKTAFTVMVGGTATTDFEVQISGTDVVLMLGEPVASGEAVTVAYTVPGTNPIQDTTGTDASAFPARSVTNTTPGCSDGQPAEAFWNACLTVGESTQASERFGYFGFGLPAADFGDLSDKDFDFNRVTYEVNGLSYQSEFDITFDRAPGAVADGWTLQVGERSFPLKEAVKSGDGDVTYSWSGLSWDSDNLGEIFPVSLRNVNRAPVVGNGIPDQTAAVGSLFSFLIPEDAFDDPDNNPLTYTAALSNGDDLPAWLTFDEATSTFTGTPGNGDAGALIITVTADDGRGDGTASDDFTLTISDGVAPVLVEAVADGNTLTVIYDEALDTTSVPDAGAFTVAVGAAAANRAVSAVQVDGEAVILTLISPVSAGQAVALSYTVPTGATPAPIRDLNGNPAVALDGTEVRNSTRACPDPSLPGNPFWRVCLTVAEQSGSFGYNAADNYGVLSTPSFSHDGNAHTISAITYESTGGLSLRFAAAPGTVAEGWTLRLGASSFDLSTAQAGADGVSYMWSSPVGFGWSSGDVGDKVTVALLQKNRAPVVANAIPDRTVTVGTALSYRIPANTFSDADGHTLTYTAALGDGSALPAWLTFDGATRVFSGTPLAANAGALSVQVTADDGNGGTASDDFTLTVQASDTTGPVLQSARVNGKVVILTYDEPLDTGSVPGTDAFTVTVGGSTGPSVSNVSIGGDTSQVGLLLAEAVSGGQAVTLTYTVPTTGATPAPIRDLSTNNAAALSGQVVMNVSPACPNPALAADAVWNACLTIGADGTTIGHSLSGGYGTLSSDAFRHDGNDFRVSQLLDSETLNQFWLSLTPNTDVSFASTWVLQIGDMKFNLSEATLGQNTFAWSPTIIDWTSANVGDKVAVALLQSNRVPVLENEVPDRAVIVGNALSYQIPANTFIDPDGDSLTYTVTLSGDGALPAWLSFDGASRSFTGTPQAGDEGTLALRLTADDLKGGTATDEFTFTVDANTLATGKPVISLPAVPLLDGKLVVGEELTAGRGDIADADGLPTDDAAFRWQWIRVDSGDETDIEGATGPAYTLQDDDLGKRIKVRVIFTDVGGSEEARTSDAARQVTLRPTELLTVTPSSTFSDNGVRKVRFTLTWNQPSNAADIQFYTFFYSPVSPRTLSLNPGVSAAEATEGYFDVEASDLRQGQYNIQLSASYSGLGLLSVPSSNALQVESLFIPAAPTGLSAVAGAGQATLSWTAPQDVGYSDITGYEVRHRTPPSTGTWQDWAPTGSDTTTHTVTNLTNGTAYEFEVRAVNAVGPGPGSAPAQATPTSTDTTAPVRQSVTARGNLLTITYNEALNEAIIPAPGAFMVTVNSGTAQPVQSVAVTGQTVLLTLPVVLVAGDTAALVYTPGAKPIRDAAGNPAAAFTIASLDIARTAVTLTRLPQPWETDAATATAPVTQWPFRLSLQFDWVVTGLDPSDFTAVNSVVERVIPPGADCIPDAPTTFCVIARATRSGGETVRVTLPADALDYGNDAAQFRATTTPSDALTVTPLTTTATQPITDAFDATITFSADVLDAQGDFPPGSHLTADDLAVTNGTAQSLARPAPGDPQTYTFSILPDSDFEGTITLQLPANAVFTEQGAGNPATLPLTLTADTNPPEITDIEVTSDPGPDDIYELGDEITFSVTFDQPVTADATSPPMLAFTLGSSTKTLAHDATASTGSTLVFTYTVADTDKDINGIAVPANSMSGTVRDENNNAAALTHARFGPFTGHNVDGTGVTLTVTDADFSWVFDDTKLTPEWSVTTAFEWTNKPANITDYQVVFRSDDRTTFHTYNTDFTDPGGQTQIAFTSDGGSGNSNVDVSLADDYDDFNGAYYKVSVRGYYEPDGADAVIIDSADVRLWVPRPVSLCSGPQAPLRCQGAPIITEGNRAVTPTTTGHEDEDDWTWTLTGPDAGLFEFGRICPRYRRL